MQNKQENEREWERSEQGDKKGALTAASPEAKQCADSGTTGNAVEMHCRLRSDWCFLQGTEQFIGSELQLRSIMKFEQDLVP